ncbi:MAG TPA: thioesterase family protein [Steroidobacteraceae bacterium]|nr:thioesterase family protein [Steroidobacteraceae bacterium]
MSGIVRNLIAIVIAYFARGQFDARSRVDSSYWVTPFDSGISVLKSDKYLQLAEAAQLDFLIKTKLLKRLTSGGIAFVNASQFVRFGKPIRIFDRVRVETQIAYSDDKCAYFSHFLFVGELQHAEVLVKMKFKKGRITVPPAEIIGACELTKPPHLEAWDQMLTAMS